MNDARLPLHGSNLPGIDWRRSGQRIQLDPAADDLAHYQVYRYCSLPEALQLLGRGEWSFAHPRSWPDRYEHHLSNTLFGDGGRFAGTSVHVKCLSFEFASNALWKTYAGAAGVLRIGMRLRDLLPALEAALPPALKLYVLRVRYLNERQLLHCVHELQSAAGNSSIAQAMRALSLKRAGFAYENELRLCLAGRSRSAAVRTLAGIRRDCVQSVLIDPYLPAWQAAEIGRLLVDTVGVHANVQQSSFDAPPVTRR